MQEETEMLTAKEATKAFRDAGLSENTFRKRVHDGLIEKYMPEGRERGALYPKDQVLAAIEAAGKKPQKIKHTIHLKPATFSQATVQDMPEIAELLLTFFSKINVEKRAKWIEKNPNIVYILRSENKVVGCAFIVPLEEQKIMQILDSEVKPPTRPHEIPTYESGKHYSLYVRSVVVLQSVNRPQRKHWASRLISGLIGEIAKLGEKGIIIDRIYAQTDARRTEHLLEMLGFSHIVSTVDNKNFMLDIMKSGAIAAVKYKRALNIWRTQNEDE